MQQLRQKSEATFPPDVCSVYILDGWDGALTHSTDSDADLFWKLSPIFTQK